MNFKAIVAAASVAVCCMGNAADAATARDGSTWDFCSYVGGGEFCADYHDTGDIVRAIVPGMGEEIMAITCSGGVAGGRSEGDWTAQQAKDFANTYCASRGWYAHD